MKALFLAALLLVGGCGGDGDVVGKPGDVDFIALHWVLDEPRRDARMCEVMGTDQRIPLDPEPVLSMSQFDTALVHGEDRHVTVRLTEAGADTLAFVTRSSIGRRIAIVVDDQVAAMPLIQGEIRTSDLPLMPQVSREAAEGLASRINSTLRRRRRK